MGRFVESIGIEAPERLERRPVDGEDVGHLAPADPSGADGRFGREVEEVVAEEVEAFSDVEPGIEIRTPLVRRERRGHCPLETRGRRTLERVADQVRWDDRADRRCKALGRVVTTPPRPDPDANAVGGDGVGRGHARSAGEGAAMHRQRYVS